MIATTVGELCRGDVDDTLTGTAWYEMYKTHEILVGVAESHTASNSTLEERS